MSGAGHGRTDGPLGQTVVEALGSITNADVTDRVVESALAAAELPRIPEEPAEVQRFAAGPLRRAVRATLGEGVATELLDSLSPIFQMARAAAEPAEADTSEDLAPATLEESVPPFARLSSSPSRAPTVRSRAGVPAAAPESFSSESLSNETTSPYLDSSPAPRDAAAEQGARDESGVRPSDPPRLASLATPESTLVILASLDRRGHARIARRLFGRATVQLAQDVFEIIALAANSPAINTIIVLDACVPAIDPLALAHRMKEIPPGTEVVLWGAPVSVWRELFAQSHGARTWQTCPGHIGHDELAARIAELIA